MLSYRSWIGEDGAMLSSDQSFSSALANAATRQLSQQAISTNAPADEDGDTIQIDVAIGANRSIGCVALLGISGFDVTGTTVVTVIRGDAGATMTYSVPAAGSVGSQNTLQGLVFLTPTGWLTNALAITIQNGSVPIKIGRIWAGPVFGLLPSAALSTIPPIDGGWTQGVIDRSEISASPGGQNYARRVTRTRSLDAVLGGLTYLQAFGGTDNLYRDGLDWIAQNYGNSDPMVFCSRINAQDDYNSAMRVRSSHLVYGRQVLPWAITQQANGDGGASVYSCPLRFEGEA